MTNKTGQNKNGTHLIILFASLLLAGNSLAGAETGSGTQGFPDGSNIVIGRSFNLSSKILPGPVRVDIALPDDYPGSNGRFPVMYAFQSSLAMAGGVAGAMAGAGAAPPIIVVSVGIDPELFSLVAEEGRPNSGSAPTLLRFLREELWPKIDSCYRTVPFRIMLGHSSSSLFAIWALFTAPDAIQAVLAAGPMFAEVDYPRVMGMMEQANAARREANQFLFFTQGDQPELTRDLLAFREWLGQKQPSGLKWAFDPEPQSNHNSLQIRTLHDGLWWLYGEWSTLPENVGLGGEPSIRAYRDKLAVRFGYAIGLSRLADQKLRAKWTSEKNGTALVALARFTCLERPDDCWSFQNLANALEVAGQWPEALEAWREALRIAKTRALDRVAVIESRITKAKMKWAASLDSSRQEDVK